MRVWEVSGTGCIATSIGCQPPWSRYNIEGQPLCDNLSMLDDYGDKLDEFSIMGKKDLLEKTRCLTPCFFMEYRVSLKYLKKGTK